MKSYLIEDVRVEIKHYLKEKGIKQTWLAEKLGITKGALSNILNRYYTISEHNLAIINEVLGTDFSNDTNGNDTNKQS